MTAAISLQAPLQDFHEIDNLRGPPFPVFRFDNVIMTGTLQRRGSAADYANYADLIRVIRAICGCLFADSSLTISLPCGTCCAAEIAMVVNTPLLFEGGELVKRTPCNVFE
jgi:hypothetical protein